VLVQEDYSRLSSLVEGEWRAIHPGGSVVSILDVEWRAVVYVSIVSIYREAAVTG